MYWQYCSIGILTFFDLELVYIYTELAYFYTPNQANVL